MSKSKLILGLVGLLSLGSNAWARIETVQGPHFELLADWGYINSPDGTPVMIWGFGNANGSGMPQYPAPTMEVTAGETVTVHLTNILDQPVSLVFPGQTGVTCTGGSAGAIAQCEADPNGGEVTYTFTASEPGTYLYSSGTRPDIQVEMGLVGAMLVRPADYALGNDANHANRKAYNHIDSRYDHEYLFLLTEMDLRVHEAVEFGDYDLVDTSDYHASLWFINGRNGPDTLNPDDLDGLNFPYQPYGALALTRPGEKVLMRVVGAGKELHPFHLHGNHALHIARDGRMLSTDAVNNGADLAFQNFTIASLPGGTFDAIWTWTGAGLGWDIYGYNKTDNPTFCDSDNGPTANYPVSTQLAADKCKPIQVILPESQSLGAGPFYSGGPFLGAAGALPPGQGGLNPWAGFFYMWHSHTERELVNNDLFPGGMLTMGVVVPPGTAIGD
jgi:FtsP/CotA-like multicopper oxidase with cupredoxin domain